MATQNQNIGFVIEHLSKEEATKLRKATLGYGMFRRFSRDVGIHENTLRGVINRGSGKPDTIRLIREKLNGDA